MKKLALFVLVMSVFQSVVFGGGMFVKPTRILLLAGKPSHAPGAHEHYEGADILAKALNDSGLRIHARVHRDSWPAAETFVGIDAVVIYGDGNDKHVAREHGDSLRALSGTGVGVVCIHYALDGEPGPLDEALLASVGGFYEEGWSHNPMWLARDVKIGDHPVANGVSAFDLKEEWYYHMRFRENMEGITPVLSALPPKEAIEPHDAEEKVNAELIAEVKAGKRQHLAWASENPSGSRGFGFSGGHFNKTWAHPQFRKLVLNGIVWAAGMDVPDDGVESETPVIVENISILQAIAKGDAEDVKRHILKGTDINEANKAGWTPLHYAAVRGKTEIASILLKNGAKVDARDGTQKTPLIYVADRNYLELAELLLDHGADINAQEKDGWGPLHYAGAKNRLEIAELLIARGGDINLVSTGGGTPLIEAAASAGPELIQLLIKNGADKTIKAKNGKTALDYAVELDNPQAVELLRYK